MRPRKQIHQRVLGERAVPGGRELRLELRLGEGERVPALLLLPAPVEGGAPGVLLLHGYSSRKEEMAGPVGGALLAEGMASLAIDLPVHGTRGATVQMQASGGPLEMVSLWRRALADARLGVSYLGARQEVDAGRLAIVGYSLGSFLSVILAAEDRRLRAVVLAAGGDLPAGTPLAAVARMVADPLAAVRKLGGRPLLMVHGKRDRTVRPEQAQRLFEAASGPKEIRWWDAGHYLPADASRGAATWLRAALNGSGGDP
jgi:uncharacterized protein